MGCFLPNADDAVHLDWSEMPLGVRISAVFVAKESAVTVPPNIRMLPFSEVVFCRGRRQELPYPLYPPSSILPANFHSPVAGLNVLKVLIWPHTATRPLGIRCILG